MPEGPEIRRAADKLEAVLRNKTVERLEFGLEPLKSFARTLQGSKVLALETRGKALLTHLTQASPSIHTTNSTAYGTL